MGWLRNQKATNPSWFWALIAVAGWSLIIQAIATYVTFLDQFEWEFALTEAPSTGEYLSAVLLSLIFALPQAGVLAGPAWAALVIARRRQHIGGAILAAEGLFLSVPVGLLWLLLILSIGAEGGLDTADTLYWGALGSLSLLCSTPPLVAGLLLLASFRRSAERKEDEMRMFRWLGGCLALAPMACWSVLVVVLVCSPWLIDCDGYSGAYYPCGRNPQMGAGGIDWRVILQVSALALAPWVIGGIVLGVVLGVRWWRSRTPAPPQATE